MRKLSILWSLIPTFAMAQYDFYQQLADSAETLSLERVIYDPSYYAIDYPNGDVPEGKGVCTDVVIRAYRKFGIDLQKEVHEDMSTNFQVYPNLWGLTRTDKNIDHRRVPNLMRFFERHGTMLRNSTRPKDYLPGDIVCWNLGGATTHIGIVTDELSGDGQTFKVIDCLRHVGS